MRSLTMQSDVEHVLAAYKELLLRYEALALSLKIQLAQDGDGGFGFGSFFFAPGRAAESGHGGSMPTSPCFGGRAPSAPVGTPRPAAAGNGLAADQSEQGGTPPSGSPSKWSPSSLLQRISSKGRSQPTSRSSTPTRSQRTSLDGAGNGGDGGAALGETLRSVSPVARLAATGKQVANHPLFNTVFGRPLGRSSPSQRAAAKQQQLDDVELFTEQLPGEEMEPQQCQQYDEQGLLQQHALLAAVAGSVEDPAASAVPAGLPLPAHQEQEADMPAQTELVLANDTLAAALTPARVSTASDTGDLISIDSSGEGGISPMHVSNTEEVAAAVLHAPSRSFGPPAASAEPLTLQLQGTGASPVGGADADAVGVGPGAAAVADQSLI